MVIDTSALIAIALGEPSRERLLDAMETAAGRVLSSMSLLEAGTVLRARLGAGAVGLLYQLVDELVSEVVPFDEIQAKLAIAAFGRFGKGMGRPAQLNFGDCAVYALAVSRGEPVLAIGNDFAATDLPAIRCAQCERFAVVTEVARICPTRHFGTWRLVAAKLCPVLDDYFSDMPVTASGPADAG